MFRNGIRLSGNLWQSHQLAILGSGQRPDNEQRGVADAIRIDDLPVCINLDAETEFVGLQQALLCKAC